MEMNAFMFDAIGDVLMAAHNQLLLRCAGSAGVNLTDRMIERGLIPMYAEIDKVTTSLVVDCDDWEGCMFDDPPPTDNDDPRGGYMTGMFRNVPSTSIPPLISYGVDGTVVVSLKAKLRYDPPSLRNATYHNRATVRKLRVSHVTSVAAYGALVRALRPSEVEVIKSPGQNDHPRFHNVETVDCENTTPDSWLSCYHINASSPTLLLPLENVTTIGDFFMVGCAGLPSIELSPLSNVTTIGSNFLLGMGAIAHIDLSPLCNVERIGPCFLHLWGLKALDLTPLTKVRHIGAQFLKCPLLEALDLSPLSNVEVIDDCGSEFLCECPQLQGVVDLAPIMYKLTSYLYQRVPTTEDVAE